MSGRWPLVAVALLVVATACGDSSSSNSATAGMTISVDTSSTKGAVVGQLATYDFKIVDTGTKDVPQLAILFDDGDHFLDHNVVVKSDPCTVDKALPGLSCGSLAHGATLAFTMSAQPKDAGNFVYKFHIGNGTSWLNEADGKGYTYSWTQAIST